MTFGKEVASVSEKFARADRRAQNLLNLEKARQKLSTMKRVKVKNTEVWHSCIYPGVPCSSRVSTLVESETDSCKSLVVACSEVKYCLLSLRSK